MEIYVAQIYIEPNVNFDFSWIFQKFIHTVLTENTIANKSFEEKYNGYTFMFRMSAKRGIAENEIKGPTIFRKDKDIEYSIFLPYDIIMKEENPNHAALKYLFDGIYKVFDKYNFDYSELSRNAETIFQTILGDKSMFTHNLLEEHE